MKTKSKHKNTRPSRPPRYYNALYVITDAEEYYRTEMAVQSLIRMGIKISQIPWR